MSAQLELDLARRAQARQPLALGRRLRGLALGGLHWAPVWVPLLFLGQLLVLGLWPALAERTRLDLAQREVEARAAALRREEQRLAEEGRMLSDEVYRERVRRSLLDPAAEPLTLERARADRP
jgi:hypothetical protein